MNVVVAGELDLLGSHVPDADLTPGCHVVVINSRHPREVALMPVKDFPRK